MNIHIYLNIIYFIFIFKYSISETRSVLRNQVWKKKYSYSTESVRKSYSCQYSSFQREPLASKITVSEETKDYAGISKVIVVKLTVSNAECKSHRIGYSIIVNRGKRRDESVVCTSSVLLK
jgi:hypothetical protein